MTVSSGDWGQNEFENAILSIQKYQDNPKTDFANLLGVSYNNVREIYYFHAFCRYILHDFHCILK